ncbi:GNAT family N-acetyltransferase [Natronomonas sp. CBA1123]|uniref:GNAT family N-acetyltransferase n=1 Tax=Natronomonas sp. CBA1123 TaxID=2668070 RepID=UPI0012EA566D|nr:GNAT family N-acetyltransferase [Natronomonas sp. CBA1123]MUV88288.1 GNAT family N-acetyltransferase [Natronomonas sp. CBA1123]
MDVRRVETDSELEDALAVRREVFIDEQGVPEHRELDGKDDEAIHFLATDEGTAVGAARMRAYDEATAKAERVAVVESHRGTGLGRALMETLETEAADRGYDAVVLHAQVPVVEFYERLDYEVTSEEFEDAGIPHREMRKQL